MATVDMTFGSVHFVTFPFAWEPTSTTTTIHTTLATMDPSSPSGTTFVALMFLIGTIRRERGSNFQIIDYNHYCCDYSNNHIVCMCGAQQYAQCIIYSILYQLPTSNIFSLYLLKTIWYFNFMKNTILVHVCQIPKVPSNLATKKSHLAITDIQTYKHTHNCTQTSR